MKNSFFISILLWVAVSCSSNQEQQEMMPLKLPTVTDNGNRIEFESADDAAFFQTEKIDTQMVESVIKAPGKIVAHVSSSESSAGNNLVIFNDSELSSNYTELVSHQNTIQKIQDVSIKRIEVELERLKKLKEHGASTGQEIANVEAELAIEQAELRHEKSAIIEFESHLKAAGLRPKALQNAKPGTSFVICRVPEYQLRNIQEGQACATVFSSYPSDTIFGKIDGITDRIAPETRMIKVRTIIENTPSKLKTGMYADVLFSLAEDNIKNIHENALVTIQGKHYVFVKKSATQFERRPVQTGKHLGDRVMIVSGLEIDDEVVTNGVLQLKGLAFGY